MPSIRCLASLSQQQGERHMCGIFGYVGNRRDAAALVLNGLEKLEYRGYDSWGIAVTDGARALVDKHVGKIAGTTTSLPDSSLGLGHTRWATHGGVTDDNAHPHTDCSGRLALVHNGIVSNDDVLRRQLSEAGHHFRSQTDTELIAHLIEEELERATAHTDQFVHAVMAAFRRLRGLNAIAVLDVQTGTLAAAKSGSPLVLGFADCGHFLASDHSAFLDHTCRVAFVKDGQAAALSHERARLFDIETGEERAPMIAVVEWKPESVEKVGHPDYMTKEIHEQPAALRRLARSAGAPVARLAAAIDASAEVFVVGCGSAFHACLATEYFFAAAGRRATAVPASEFAHLLPLLKPDSLVIALSQSGETIDVLEAVQGARVQGARIAAVTNVEGSALFRLADLTISLGVGPERCVLATKSFTAKLALLLLTAGALEGDLERAAVSIERAADDIASLLCGDRHADLLAVARTLDESDHLYVIGRGVSFPVALETALKIKEVSYLHAEGFAGGELKHGVIALIEPGTPCIVIAPNDGTRHDILAGARQVQARGGVLIGVASERHDAFDHFIEVADVGRASILANSVVPQLLGYELARLRGHDPDKPRNLAKSVTVK
jgi:glutamine---fructose-6-phosphate transaminase (isomerizing)